MSLPKMHKLGHLKYLKISKNKIFNIFFMNFIKKIIIVLLFLFPISNSFGAIISEVDDQEFADGDSNSMSGIHFNDDGTKMFLLYQGGTHTDDHTYINQYNLI